MADIVILKRTRLSVDESWSAWLATTDMPPYTNTELIEYKVAADSVIDIENFTDGYVDEAADGTKSWEGTGVFDTVIKAVNGNIQVEYDNGRITGPAYAQVYLGSMNNAMNLAMQFLLRERQTELQLEKAEEELRLLYDTHPSRVQLSENQAAKVLEEKKALVQSVIDNRKIRALDSLADTYGTFGAGGLTLSEDMWKVYFKLIADLVSELNDYKGSWDATTNTPDLSAITDPLPGDFYRVAVAGSIDLDGTSTWAENDIVVYTIGIDGDASNGYWKKSSVTLPTSTTVSVVT